jgi:hypothetical protein
VTSLESNRAAVATSTLKKGSGFLRADWFVSALVVVGVLMLHQ